MGFVSCCMRTNTTYIELRLNFFLWIYVCVCVYFVFFSFLSFSTNTYACTRTHTTKIYACVGVTTVFISISIRCLNSIHTYTHLYTNETDRETPTLHIDIQTLTATKNTPFGRNRNDAYFNILLVCLYEWVCVFIRPNRKRCVNVYADVFDLEIGTERNARIRITVEKRNVFLFVKWK